MVGLREHVIQVAEYTAKEIGFRIPGCQHAKLQSYSQENACTAVNLDIGGGTTNIVIFDNGKVVSKGCVDIGGRQIRLDSDYTVRYISPSARIIADKLGVTIEVGQRTDKESIKRICAEMVSLLEQLLGIYDKTPILERIITNGSTHLEINKPIKAICFSGGVADCIYNTSHETLQYGDIGVLLGAAVREGRLFSDFKLIHAKETIRATVVGAGTYTTSISGSTISYSDGLLPLKNIPVLKLNSKEQSLIFSGDGSFLKEKIQWFASQSDTSRLVLAFDGKNNPSYDEIKSLANAAGGALDEFLPDGEPMIIVTQSDIAKVLGQVLKRLYGQKRDIISVDSISVDDGDFVDLGSPLMDGMVIPVVVKTLIFG